VQGMLLKKLVGSFNNGSNWFCLYMCNALDYLQHEVVYLGHII
jgi:hypothetical protein